MTAPIMIARLSAAVAALFIAPSTLLAGVAIPVTPDGFFNEWKNVEPLHVDPAGDDTNSDIDLGALSITNDEQAIYLRFEVGRETILQNGPGESAGNNMRLLIDLDNSASSGRPTEGLGVEIEIRFGRRTLQVFSSSGSPTDWRPAPLGIMGLPTHSSSEFELRVPFAASQSDAIRDHLSSGGELALVLEQVSGDRQPDSGSITYRVSTDEVKPVKAKNLAKKRKKFVRLMTMNVERTTISQQREIYTRILQAVRPDVIAFQEIYEWSAARTRELVEEALPLDDGREWEAYQVEDTVTVSSYPIMAAAGIDQNHVVHIDLPDDKTKHDLVLFNAHTPCCDQNLFRDFEHDNLAATWRDLLENQGPFPIQPRDMVVITGDLNMVGYRRQLDVLLNGTFIDPTSGPDFSPGRARGSLNAIPLRHTHRRLTTTWRSSDSAYAPGRLDYMIYSKDVARAKKNFTLDTAELPEEVLEDFGLELDDSVRASDHLTLVADFKIKKK